MSPCKIFLISAPGVSELIMLAIALVVILMPVYCIYDIIKNRNWDNTKTLLWIIIVVFMPFLGSIIYLLSKKYNRI